MVKNTNKLKEMNKKYIDQILLSGKLMIENNYSQ